MILVGAVHGITLSVLLLWSSRNRRTSNWLLALLLLLYTLPLLKVVFRDVGLATLTPWSRIELLYGLGPALYLYVKTVTDQAYTLSRRDWAHFMPVGLELMYYLGPWFSKNQVHAFVPPIDAWHVAWMVEQGAGVVSILVYLCLTNRLLWRYASWVRRHYADEHGRALRWLRIPVGLYTVFFMLWLSLRVVDVARFEDALPIEPYYPLLLFLSLSTYWIGTRGYLESQATTTGFFQAGPVSLTEPAEDEALLGTLFGRLERLMHDEHAYRENDLSLAELAERLEVNPRLLSRAINTQFAANFHDYVNGYRVADVQRRLRDAGPKRTLLDVAHESGFGSKATFNAVFKKATGLTPSRYRAQHLNDDPAA